MVNLQALEAAIGKVERIRDHEFTFEVEDTEVTLRPLRPDEETEVQRYSQVAMENVTTEEGDQAAFADFMDRMRHASLAFSVVQIGGLDLRDVEFVETGEQDEKGNMISIPRWEAVRDLMAREWSRMMLSQVFGKFGEMLERLEVSAQKRIKFEPVDLDEEIERLERRLAGLKETKSQIKEPPQDVIRDRQKAVVERDEVAAKVRDAVRSGPRPEETVPADVQAAVDEVVEEPPQQAPQEEPQQAQGRRSAIPTSASAPERSGPPQPPQQPQQPQQPEPPGPELDKQGIPEPHGGDSFFDPSDPEQAMAAEAQRQAVLHQRHIAKQRQAAKQRQMQEEMGIPTQDQMNAERMAADRASQSPRGVNLDTSPGGLRSAANVSDAVMDSGAGSMQSGRPKQQPQPAQGGTPARMHGKPVFKMPAQNLDRPERENQRQHGEPAPSPVKINTPSPGGRQSKFRGPEQQ
jgi:hypothetical protein